MHIMSLAHAVSCSLRNLQSSESFIRTVLMSQVPVVLVDGPNFTTPSPHGEAAIQCTLLNENERLHTHTVNAVVKVAKSDYKRRLILVTGVASASCTLWPVREEREAVEQTVGDGVTV